MFRSVIAVCALLLSVVQAFAQSDFKVTLLGTASPAPRTNRFGPSTLVEVGGQVLLFDAGRGVPIRMGQLKVPVGKIDVAMSSGSIRMLYGWIIVLPPG